MGHGIRKVGGKALVILIESSPKPFGLLLQPRHFL
jgi:hypothetical protein